MGIGRQRHQTSLDDRHPEAGQVVILVSTLLVALVGFASLAVDVGRFTRGRQDVQRMVDAAALAGVQGLPESGVVAEHLARAYAQRNGYRPDDPLDVSFRCLVGDRNGDGRPDLEDVAAICGQFMPPLPGAEPGGDFRCAKGLCVSRHCEWNPDQPDAKCNTIVVEGSQNVPLFLAPVLGVSGLSTGALRGSACGGLCGAPPTADLDVVMIIDRSRSMDTVVPPGLQKAKEAAKAVLTSFHPDRQHVALAVLPQCELCNPNGAANTCKAVPNADLEDRDTGEWILMPLTDDYDALETAIDCVAIAEPATQAFPPKTFPQTNLQEPVLRAQEHLEQHGRSGVKKGIMLLTDGAADLSSDGNPCRDAFEQATRAKESASQITIVTIGFNIAIRKCTREQDQTTNPYRNSQTPATKLLADMASPNASGEPADDNGCTSEENADGDYFFCEPAENDLVKVFRLAAEALARTRPRLVHVVD